LNDLEDRSERGEPGDALDTGLHAGFDHHCNYDKGLRALLRIAAMTEKTLNLRGLKCPLPALRTRKALGQSQPGDLLIVECTDPLAGIDIPNLLRQTGDKLEDSRKDKKLLTFRIRKV
jgi:tRNA 2-thiouridine synthesizing protein A